MPSSSRALMLALAVFGIFAVTAVIPSGPARADMRSLLLGRSGTKNVGAGVFEVTARGNNMREKRSSLDLAMIKAAKRAAQENGAYIAILREKSGTWMMGGRRLGDETTLRFKVLGNPEAVVDEDGNPARIHKVSDLLAQAE